MRDLFRTRSLNFDCRTRHCRWDGGYSSSGAQMTRSLGRHLWPRLVRLKRVSDEKMVLERERTPRFLTWNEANSNLDLFALAYVLGHLPLPDLPPSCCERACPLQFFRLSSHKPPITTFSVNWNQKNTCFAWTNGYVMIYIYSWMTITSVAKGCCSKNLCNHNVPRSFFVSSPVYSASSHIRPVYSYFVYSILCLRHVAAACLCNLCGNHCPHPGRRPSWCKNAMYDYVSLYRYICIGRPWFYCRD